MDLQNTKLKNIAIIAHVDHGKTTLVDAILRQSHIFRENEEKMTEDRILDSNELEREKGITIKAKNIAVNYKDYRINIIDTPGHADFGGEVERTLNMADGCLLLVDAQEGPMPQTKFVLKKALELGLQPIVVINKIDKNFANPERTLDLVNDLFLTLATEESQLEFPVFYAIAREGKVFAEMPEGDLTVAKGDITPLMESIIEKVPSPKGDSSEPLQMQISSLDHDDHLGRLLIGRISRGTININDNVIVISSDNDLEKKEKGTIRKIYVRDGLKYQEVQEAGIGEIVAVAGVESTAIGGTLCIASKPEKLPTIKISEPSVQIKIEANTSPFLGRDGEFVTAKQIQQRLEKEGENNISLKISKADAGAYFVAGRGELQLSILLETMRREGFEFQVRKPEVVYTKINGKDYEPLEELVIEVNKEYQGVVNVALNARKAELLNIEQSQGDENEQVTFTYKILTRNLLGLRNELIPATKGNIVMNNFLIDHVRVTPQPEIFRKGVMISMDTGVAIGYSLNTIQERGDLFIEPSTQVYEGMIIGINKYENDMEVNPTKSRQKSAVRMKHDEITQTALKPIIPVTLDFALSFLGKDEILEVTPKNLRLRKQYLTSHERAWSKRKNLTEYAKKQMGMS
ncbi:GTP-binding protein [Candidatus Dojkabacteria bacterium]|nr:GTP-binding protein [Candidatus Dojkabacteria bacterium]